MMASQRRFSNGAVCSRTDHPRLRSRRAAVGAGLAALVIVGAAALTAYVWRAQMPDQIAMHWNSAGYPTRFRSLPGAVIETIVVTTIPIIAFSAICATAKVAATRKITAAMSIWIAVFPSLLLLSQRSTSDPTTTPISVIWLLLSLIPAIATYLLVPGDNPLPATTPIPENAPRLPIAQNQRAAWFRRTVDIRALFVSAIAIIPLGVAAWHAQSNILKIAVSLLILITIIDFTVEIQVSVKGVVVRSIFGWPRSYIPANEIQRASVIEVNPLSDFGGWGWRLVPGRIGFVTQSGEALLIERTGGRALVVSTDDADNAAALLNTFADQTVELGNGRHP